MRRLWRRKMIWSFTLIELLVVVAIIGLLIGMLMPAIAAARERARRAKCGSNLSAIGKVMAIYSMDHSENYPKGFKHKDRNLGLADYAANAKLYVCPSDLRLPTNEFGRMTEDTCSYTLIHRLPSSSSEDAHAMDKDGMSGGSDGKGGVDDKSFGGNHAGDGGNILYVDGSVQWITRSAWIADGSNVWGFTPDWVTNCSQY